VLTKERIKVRISRLAEVEVAKAEVVYEAKVSGLG
jgi:hypothetical protein